MTYIPGGASAAKQDTGNTSLASLDAKTPALVAGKVPVDIGGESVVIAIPAGASTSAKQDTGNTSLASIDTKTPALVSGKVPVDVGGESISVSNFPATQPVSAAALPLPAGASTEATLALIKAKTDNIDVLLSTRTKPADTQPVSAAALPLPTGASTSAAQTTAQTSLTSIDGKTPALASGRVPVDPSGVTSPVSAASLPLPTGASTSAAQTTAQTSLSSIDTKTPALVSGKVPVDVGGESISVSNFPAAQAREAGAIYVGGVSLTVFYAKIQTSTSGASTVVAAVSGKKIRVIGFRLSASAAVNVKFQSHVTPTDLTGLAYYAANGGEVVPKNEYGWFETVAGEALDLNLSAAVAVGGSLAYVTV
jgi:hypothetical protein